MSEFDKSSIERLLVKGTRPDSQIEGVWDEVIRILETSAKKTFEAYEVEIQTLLPDAQKKLDEIVIPWWRELEKSGLFKRIFEYLNQGVFRIGFDPVTILSEPIVFPWLRVSPTQYDFAGYARFLWEAEGWNKQRVQMAATRAFESHYSYRNLWTAHFYIAGEYQFRHEPGFGISRWPIAGGGYAYAVVARENDVCLRLSQAEQLITKIHPDVIISFAEQIESGQIDRRLQESLRPKSLIAISSGVEYERSQMELAKRYLEKKQVRSASE